MEKYLEGEEPSIEDLKRCIRKGTLQLDFFLHTVVLHSKTKVCS